VTPLFSAARRPELHALAIAFVPAIATATAAEWSALEAAIEHAVSTRHPALRRQLALLLRAIAWLARLRYGRVLERLSPAELDRLLTSLSISRIALLRRGIWGLRTLIMLGWYTQPGVAASLGYRASAEGWGAQR
jgi:hypothetical protein